MSRVNGIAEFLNNVAKLKKTEEKVTALKFNDSIQLRIVLQGMFDPSVKWLLPEGDPPYVPNKLVDQEHVLIKDVEKLRYYIEGFYPSLKQAKRETMFVELLERVAPADAVLLCQMKDKKRIPGITIDHVKAAFPDLIVEAEKV